MPAGGLVLVRREQPKVTQVFLATSQVSLLLEADEAFLTLQLGSYPILGG